MNFKNTEKKIEEIVNEMKNEWLNIKDNYDYFMELCIDKEIWDDFNIYIEKIAILKYK